MWLSQEKNCKAFFLSSKSRSSSLFIYGQSLLFKGFINRTRAHRDSQSRLLGGRLSTRPPALSVAAAARKGPAANVWWRAAVWREYWPWPNYHVYGQSDTATIQFCARCVRECADAWRSSKSWHGACMYLHVSAAQGLEISRHEGPSHADWMMRRWDSR